jgi:hypothetical protein
MTLAEGSLSFRLEVVSSLRRAKRLLLPAEDGGRGDWEGPGVSAVDRARASTSRLFIAARSRESR